MNPFRTPDEVRDAPTPWSVHPCQLSDGTVEHHLVDARDHTLIRQRDVNGRSGQFAIDFLQRLADNANAASAEVKDLARIVQRYDSMGPYGATGTHRHLASSLLAHHIVGQK